jgi:predicted metal-dependent hydrolase
MAEPIPAEFWDAIAQFNQEQFYACHDTLEALWIESPEPSRKFYQGILQIAVACYHLSNGNLNGAIILLGEGVGRLNSYQPAYSEIQVSHLMADSVNLLQALQEISMRLPITDSKISPSTASWANLSDLRSQVPKIERISSL